LRLSVGQTGQQDIGNTSAQYYAYQSVYLQSQNTAQYQFGSNYINTLRPAGYDAKIKWETTTSYNAAFDYGLFKNRVYGTLEVYKRDTRDLLNTIPVAAGTNLTNYITTNVGNLTNKGVEFSLNVVAIKTDDASWEIGGNVTYNHNEITKLTATDDPNYPGVYTGAISGGVGNTIQVQSVGYSTNQFLVYEQVYDKKGVPIEGLYVDRNGDGQVTPADRYRYKSPNAPVYFGFYSSYTRGNWDFSFAGRANVGNYMYNNVLSTSGNYNNLYNSAGYLNNVHSETSNIDFAVPQYFSDHYVQKASFLRLDHITLGYTVNKLWKISRLRVYGTVQNPIKITQYKGLDPEVFGGIDNNIYPRARTFVFGVNASF
jgi:iron complex outermembrane receptor protein